MIVAINNIAIKNKRVWREAPDSLITIHKSVATLL